MLRSFADRNFDCRRRPFPSSRRGFLTLNDGLDAVPQELANYIFKMREDVGECGVEVAGEVDCGEGSGGAVGRGAKGKDGGVTAVYYLAGIALEEDFADEFGAGIGGIGGVGEVPGAVEGFC